MTSWWGRLWWGGNDPDDVNAVTGLTRREEYFLQKTWTRIYAECIRNGSEIFIQLFRTYPETKKFFHMISKIPEEELSKNPQFRAHVSSFMAAFNIAITNIQEPEIVVALMNKIGISHMERKVKEQHFLQLKKVLKEGLLEKFKLNSTGIVAWEKFIDFMYKHIFESLNKKDNKE